MMKSNFKEVINKSQEVKLNIKKGVNVNLEISKDIEVNIINIIKSNQSINSTIDIYVLEGSRVYFNNFDYININTNININVYLKKSAQVYINSIVISDNIQKKYNIKVVNEEEKSKGYILQKAVVKNKGEAQFLATGKINKSAKYSDNFQESRVLLLEDAKRGEATPFLYINNNEVKAGHKAVISEVDAESLYYLQTRGINKKEAQTLLTHAFLNSVVQKMSIGDELKEKLKGDINV